MLGARRELVAELADLRIAAQRIEARDHKAQLAVQALDEGRSRARGRIDGRGIFLQHPLQIGIEIGDIRLDLIGSRGNQIVGELKPLGIGFPQTPPWAVAGAAVGAGASRCALGRGLLRRDGTERGERALQKLKPALSGL